MTNCAKNLGLPELPKTRFKVSLPGRGPDTPRRATPSTAGPREKPFCANHPRTARGRKCKTNRSLKHERTKQSPRGPRLACAGPVPGGKNEKTCASPAERDIGPMKTNLRNTSRGLQALMRAYQNAKPDDLGLFLGAGVNLPPSGKDTPGLRFRAYCWTQLLEELHNKNPGLRQTFDELRSRHGDDWLGLASELVGDLDVEGFIDQMDAIVYNNRMPRGDRYGRLSKRFLAQAPTLHAAIAFATVVSRRTGTSWTFARNPRIGMVITPNYDFYFGAGWTRYQAFDKHWKVQTPFSQRQPERQQRPINYIHGYLPYKPGEKKDIVLTRASYEAAYRPPEAFAARVLRESARRYRLIFLGTSFDDPPLRQALRETATQRQHFAIVREPMAERVRRLGVLPVVVEDYAQIPTALRTVYCAALGVDQCRQLGLADPDAYWNRLSMGPVTLRQRAKH